MKIRVFLFHRVHPDTDDFWPPMHPNQFQKTLQYISKRYEIVSLENTLQKTTQIETKKPLAAIVFDDGYRDFLEYAFPILEKMDLPSSMYIVTNCVNEALPPWTYILDYSFVHTTKKSCNLDSFSLPSHLRNTLWNDDQERIQYGKELKPFLKTLPNKQRGMIYYQLIHTFDDVRIPNNLMLDWDDVRYLSKKGVTIGSHTVSHPLLEKIETEIEIEEELGVSYEEIAQEVAAPLSISYPIGSYDDRVKNISKKIGYKYGLAVNHLSYNQEKHDLFEIPRIDLYTESFFKSKMRINGSLMRIKQLINKA